MKPHRHIIKQGVADFHQVLPVQVEHKKQQKYVVLFPDVIVVSDYKKRGMAESIEFDHPIKIHLEDVLELVVLTDESNHLNIVKKSENFRLTFKNKEECHQWFQKLTEVIDKLKPVWWPI